jgi:membrane protein
MHEHAVSRTYPIFDNQIHWFGKKLRKVILPGFDKVPMYDVIWFFIYRLKKGSVNIRATSIAFNFLLAVGPGIVFLLAMIPYIPIANFQKELLGVLNQIIPENSYIAIESIINEIFHKRTGLPFFGFIISLFFAQKGLHGMMGAFTSSFESHEQRPWYKQRAIAILLVFIYYILIILSLAMVFFNKSFIRQLVEIGIIRSHLTYYFLIISRWIIMVSMTFFCISFLYYMAPQRKIKWKFFSAGSTLATLLVLLASYGFTYFVNHFAQFNKFFGSIGALVALMLWINFNSLSLIIGFELNTSINKANLQLVEQ